MYRTLKVVRTETKTPSNGLCTILGKLVYCPMSKDDHLNAIYQNLYFVGSETVEEGDWFWDSINDHIVQCTDSGLKKSILADETQMAYDRRDSYKIVGSTDERLNLPLIPDKYVKKYVRKSGYLDINVEYTIDGYGPSVNKDNEIIISPQSNMFTQSDVIALLHDYREYVWKNGATLTDLETWINETLD